MSVASSRTNGFLFADLRDYTRYVESHGDQAAVTLLERYRALVRSAVAELGGAEIKTEGDSFYVVFPSASSAVQCGLAILAAATEQSRDGIPIEVGIGVHAGETVETSEGYVGSAVNVAARVCSQARPGELLVTDTVRALTRTFLPVSFVDRRSRRLKGIAEPVVIYRAVALEPGVGIAPRVGGLRGRIPSSSGLGRTTRVAVLVIGLFIGGAAAGYLLIAAQRPPTGPTESSRPSPSSPTSDATAFPNVAENDLLLQVPTGIRDSCRRTEEAAERVGTVSLRCDLQLTAEAETVWYDRFDNLQALSFYIAQVTQREQLPFAMCDTLVPRAQGNWQTGSTHSGRLLCYAEEDRTWIEWSYDAERIVARAVRSGQTADDWLSLLAWWKQVRLFLR